LSRGEGEPLGMHIKGGVDNPGNPLVVEDSGIFISKILPNGAIHRVGLLRVIYPLNYKIIGLKKGL